jgi:hypothetical protein
MRDLLRKRQAASNLQFQKFFVVLFQNYLLPCAFSLGNSYINETVYLSSFQKKKISLSFQIF